MVALSPSSILLSLVDWLAPSRLASPIHLGSGEILVLYRSLRIDRKRASQVRGESARERERERERGIGIARYSRIGTKRLGGTRQQQQQQQQTNNNSCSCNCSNITTTARCSSRQRWRERASALAPYGALLATALLAADAEAREEARLCLAARLHSFLRRRQTVPDDDHGPTTMNNSNRLVSSLLFSVRLWLVYARHRRTLRALPCGRSWSRIDRRLRHWSCAALPRSVLGGRPGSYAASASASRRSWPAQKRRCLTTTTTNSSWSWSSSCWNWSSSWSSSC